MISFLEGPELIIVLVVVLVLFGGRSAESDVSVVSGTAIAAALIASKLPRYAPASNKP